MISLSCSVHSVDTQQAVQHIETQGAPDLSCQRRLNVRRVNAPQTLDDDRPQTKKSHEKDVIIWRPMRAASGEIQAEGGSIWGNGLTRLGERQGELSGGKSQHGMAGCMHRHREDECDGLAGPLQSLSDGTYVKTESSGGGHSLS
jgi:hypothetical protein